MSVAPEIFKTMEATGIADASVQDATLIALSSTNNRAFLEPPYGAPPMNFKSSATVLYLSGEFVLKDRFVCARYVTCGSAYQPKVVAHMAPGPLDGMFVERPATGPLGRGCRVLSSPRSWYAPGKVLVEVPKRPLQHEDKIVLISACAVVRGDGAVYLTSTGHAILLEPRKMATEGASKAPLAQLGLSTQLLVPSLVDTMTRFFSLPFAAQPRGQHQLRIFRVDGWMKEGHAVHSLELHTTGFADLVDEGGGPIDEAVQIVANPSSYERLRIATLTPPPVAGAKESALRLSRQVQRLMTAGDADDPHAWQYEENHTDRDAETHSEQITQKTTAVSPQPQPLRAKPVIRQRSRDLLPGVIDSESESNTDTDSDSDGDGNQPFAARNRARRVR